MATSAANRAEPRRTRRQVIPVHDPVLTSKITVPGVPGWAVQRPRINKLIGQDGGWRPLTVVTGPPGAGKTMALALLAAAHPGAVAWITLDDYDNQPKVFWSYVVAALRQTGMALPRALSAVIRGEAVDHMFLRRLASALAAQDPPVTLVIDDLHLLTESEVLDGLDYVLRNVGSGLRLVVATRVDPLLPLHRYRLAGELTEIRAADLALSGREAGLVMAQHGISLSADSLECLIQRTEGWAAGIRLAAISMDTHPDPDQFVKELIAEDSAVTGYLVEEVLNTQPPGVRDMLLSTSVLERVSDDIATEMTGHAQAAGILPAVAHANAFVQPLGCGWYRYHPLFAEVLRLKLRREYPERVATLHQRAARWFERNGPLTEAVRHAAEAGDWKLAAGMVIDALAIGEIIEPWGTQSLAGEFRSMPDSEALSELQPLLVSAAIALSVGRYNLSTVSLGVAEGILDGLPGDQAAAARLAAAMVRLAASRRTGDLAGAAAATACAEVMVERLTGDKLARHPEIRVRVLFGRGAVELWSGHIDEAARVLDSSVAAATVSGGEYERAMSLGHLALVEALRGRLRRAANLAAAATTAPATDSPLPPVRHPNPAAFVALAWVHLERNELRKARSRLKQADAALGLSPDKLVGAIACLVAACGGLAEGRSGVAAQMVAMARRGWSVPPWLEQRLSLVESQAYGVAGDTRAALAAAERAGRDSSLEAAVTLAHAWVAAGDRTQARRALAPALATSEEVPERARLQAWLVDARLSYDSGDRVRGRRSLETALRLGEREQLRLPFAMERAWLRLVLGRDPDLARAHRHLLAPSLISPGVVSASQATKAQVAPLIVEQLSDREREVLRCVSGMLSTAEVASQMYISVNTVKTHLKSIYRKLEATHRGEAVRRARQLELI
jgi:LuxR family transcriptional regulator, maltose regulon positive regulatory protein